MNGLKTRLGLAALGAALVAAGAFFFVSQAAAVTGTLGAYAENARNHSDLCPEAGGGP